MKKALVLIGVMLLLVSSGCQKFSDNGTGRLLIKITDAPFPFADIESAVVSVERIELRKAGDGIADGNPFITVAEDAGEFNLVELRNGVVELLSDIEIPAGEYDLVRLYVGPANLTVKGGDVYNLKIPSGEQTGIKIFIRPSLIVEGGLTSELLLDFDLSRSFVMRGNLINPSESNGFIFKPVIRAVNNSSAGRIEGFVKDEAGIAIEGVSVKIEQDGEEIASALTNAEGFFAVLGLPAGEYSATASKTGFKILTQDEIKVSAGNKTIVNFVLQAE